MTLLKSYGKNPNAKTITPTPFLPDGGRYPAQAEWLISTQGVAKAAEPWQTPATLFEKIKISLLQDSIFPSFAYMMQAFDCGSIFILLTRQPSKRF